MSTTRRDLLRGGLAAAGLAVSSAARSAQGTQRSQEGPATEGPATRPAAPRERRRVVVVGAGALGGWTAYELQRRGARVILLDAWGPGNARASSGGETRVIRTVYGAQAHYTDLALRALELWRDAEKRFGRRLYHRTGMLVLGTDPLIADALPILATRDVALEEMTPGEAARRYPQIHCDDLDRVVLEVDAGFLLARTACRLVVEHFIAAGGSYRRAAVRPAAIDRLVDSASTPRVSLDDGSSLDADTVVFACGSWLPKLFPELLGPRIRPSRQEVYYFGTPAGDARFGIDRLPIWTDRSDGGFYGIPGNQDRGFKIADHGVGPAFDPTRDDRLPTPGALERARRFIMHRFPALADAPLIESRVCHYANTTDGELLIDRHPNHGAIWLAGGGSGHAFKHGPALGELIARAVLDEQPPDPRYSVSRRTATR
ncbi:MAG: FAD-dependent oxidoreductase [Acidobacteriota bacterium]